jgi:hypothetical protein
MNHQTKTPIRVIVHLLIRTLDKISLSLERDFCPSGEEEG